MSGKPTSASETASGFQHLDVFKGTGKSEVIVLAIIGESSSGEVRVAEKAKDGYFEYVKPLSEISEEVNNGSLKRTGKTAKSVEAVRSSLQV